MIDFIAVVVSCILTAIAVLFLVAGSVHGDLNTCRAANPGYDCDIGWVRGEQFK